MFRPSFINKSQVDIQFSHSFPLIKFSDIILCINTYGFKKNIFRSELFLNLLQLKKTNSYN